MKNRNFIIILFLIAIVSGIVWGMPFNKPLGSDASTFNTTALTILEKGLFYNGEIMNHMIERIFYPVFLSGVYKIFGYNPMLVRFIQVFIFAGLVLLVYKLGQYLFNERLARIAGLTTAFCYSIASFTGSLYRELFFTTLIFCLVYCLYQAQIKKKIFWFALAGAVFGIASLTNGVIQFFIIIIIVNFSILHRKEGIRKIVPRLSVFILAFILVISPWIINDYVNFGRTPFFSKQGFVLIMKTEKMDAIKGKYIQHFIANTTGDFFAQKLFSDYDRSEARLGWDTRDDWQRMIYQENEDRKEVNELLTKEALREIIKHPILFLQMSSLDFLKFNTPMVPNVRMQHMFAEPGSYPQLPDFIKGGIILSIRFLYLILAVLVVYGAVKNIRNWSKIGWIVLIVVYFNSVFSNIHAIARYSVPVYPFYIILFSLGLMAFLGKIREKYGIKIW